MEYITESGYVVRDTLSGADIEDSNGNHVCELPVNLSHFENEDGSIDEENLEQAIENELEVENFLEYQSDYC